MLATKSSKGSSVLKLMVGSSYLLSLMMTRSYVPGASRSRGVLQSASGGNSATSLCVAAS